MLRFNSQLIFIASKRDYDDENLSSGLWGAVRTDILRILSLLFITYYIQSNSFHCFEFYSEQKGAFPDLMATSGDYLRVWRVGDTETRLECLLNNVRVSADILNDLKSCHECSEVLVQFYLFSLPIQISKCWNCVETRFVHAMELWLQIDSALLKFSYVIHIALIRCRVDRSWMLENR